MSLDSRLTGHQFKPIADEYLISALNELSRSINILTTYGKNHPVVKEALDKAEVALNTLFSTRSKLTLGAFNAILTIDEAPVQVRGTLLKSLERRLTALQITSLSINKGITSNELLQLTDLFSLEETSEFHSGIESRNLPHISTTNIEFKAVRESQTVANNSDLTGGGTTLVLEDETQSRSANESEASPDIQVDQIVGFLKGDIELNNNEELGEELTQLISDPATLGKIIMESVAIRQSVSDLSGESLGDIIIGCLRRTYNGINEQPAFKTSEGKEEMRKALLLLEENLLDRMHDLTGSENPELERQIVQTIREMDESLGFESAAMEYMKHRGAIEQNRKELQKFIESRGKDTAGDIISNTDFPQSEWHRIVVESNKNSSLVEHELSPMSSVFEHLEILMKSDDTNATAVKDLMDQATENLDDTLFTTKEKLEVLSQQLREGQGDTIGGQGRNMTREELLASLAEVAQELMQPLTAITASLEMMLHGFVGDVTVEQRDLLDLAGNSGEHLKFLMKELIGIVGCPANKGVDSRYHTTSEKVILMQDAEGQEHLPLNYR